MGVLVECRLKDEKMGVLVECRLQWELRMRKWEC